MNVCSANHDSNFGFELPKKNQKSLMLSLIVAMAANGAIGKDNAMPWHLPGDLQYFKTITTGKTLIMGRKTFESLPKILPNRRHIIITSKPEYAKFHPGVETASSLNDAIAKAPSADEAFIIGGSSIYREALPLCERLYITEIYADFDADTFFPEVDYSRYELVSQSEILSDGGVAYRFMQYRRLL